jgi:UDP-apiose/xylose synthase
MEPLLDGKAMQLVDGGHAKRTITSIHDASDALLLILGNPAAAQNQIFNVGNTENEVSIAELAVLMREIFADVTGDASVKRNPIEVVSSQQFYGEGYEDCDRRSSGYDQSNPVARLVADAVAATNLVRDDHLLLRIIRT